MLLLILWSREEVLSSGPLSFTATQGIAAAVYRRMEFLHLAALLWILNVAAAQYYYPSYWPYPPPPPGPNLALRGRATQSSVYTGISTAINAIDGNPDSNFNHGSCAITNYELSPWWRVDLLAPHKISQIIITNRGDCCGSRLNGASILIGNSLQNNGNNNPSCTQITSIGNGATQTFQCNGMVGRYLNIILPGQWNYLQLCEVRVYGIPTSGKPCY
ncbi:fucolectin-like [Hyperolius riggenbachi]|uniref:fucolectin-like n=1 Tax=Hyperolius riggenbachi TaxID=752182 RepID=UPI0035A2D0FA